jgi:hypothetical protein
MPKKTGKRIEPASSEVALDFIRKMQKAFPKTPRTRKEKGRLQKYLEGFSDDELKAVGSRLLSDVMLRPPRTINAGDYPLRREAGTASVRDAAPPRKRAPSKRAVKARAQAKKRT